MKRILLLTAAICFLSIAYAQTEKYTSAMKSNIVQLDSIMARNNAEELANNFVRIGDAEKTKWLPYYYAAYCTIIRGLTEKDGAQKDAIADKANELITKAETILGKPNSEIEVIKSMIATVHMTVDPASRYMAYGSAIAGGIKNSIALDSTNPRPVLLAAQNNFYTPETYGGGKDKAKPYFDKAAKLYENFKPETDLSPTWGKLTLDYFLSQYK